VKALRKLGEKIGEQRVVRLFGPPRQPAADGTGESWAPFMRGPEGESPEDREKRVDSAIAARWPDQETPVPVREVAAFWEQIRGPNDLPRPFTGARLFRLVSECQKSMSMA
jgi:hypothetical protein